MATINTYTGDGSTTLYSLTFEYLDETDVKVKINGTPTSAYSFANATQLLFNTAPANGAEIIIYRNTDVSEPIVSFFAGSSIRAQDLNAASDQVRFSVEEWRDQTVPLYDAVLPDDINMGGNQINNMGEPTSSHDAATKNYVDTTTWNVTDETLQSGEAWVSSNAYVATSQSIDQRIDAKIDTAITSDIGTDGTGITVTNDGDGTITLGLADNTIDFSKIKNTDIVTYAEQNAGSPAWESDSLLATTWAAARRFDTIVQTTTPSGTDWQIGKTWLQNDANKTLSIWNGSTWLGIASGGTFTTQPTVIYVDSVNGDDANDGHRIINPKETIKAAVADANDGDIIIVAPGVYQEILPIDITVNNLSIVGSSQRSCFVIPAVGDEEETMFRCNSGTYIDGFTFTGLKASGTRGNNALDDDPTYGLPENQGWVASFYPGCTILKSPYINNCTSYMDSAVDVSNFDPNNPAGTGGDTTSAMTGGGILVDGSVPATASPLRSFVVNEFTQVNLDGPGLLVTNNGYAQAVSFFALFCHYHAKALNGGQINMEVGTTDFGRYGLIADGKSSSTIFTATANGAASTGATSFLINAPSASAGWFGSATRPANTMLVEVGGNIYPILSSSANGSGWSVVISNPDAANRSINNGLVNGHSNGAAVNFYLRSQISAAAHTFEYAGSGVNYSALPQNGGVANESNQVIQTGAAAIAGNQTEGAVFYSSTDENGKFKVGDTFQVDQKTGFVTIDPTSVATNVVSDLTPQLGGNLDVLTRSITTSVTNGDVVITPNGTGNVVLDGLRYPETDGSNGQFLQTDGAGNLTFQSAITEVLQDTSPQLGGNLDILTRSINTSTTNGDIDLDANGSGLIKVTEYNLSQVPIVTQHDIGTAANEIPLNGMLGGMAFQDPASVSIDGGNFGGLTVNSAAADDSVTLDSSGRLLVNTSTARTWSGTTGQFQLEGTSIATSSPFFISNQNDGYGPFMVLGKSRGTSVGSNTIVQNGDIIGAIEFAGADGSALRSAAEITCRVDANPGASDMPGRLMFSTTADGASSPTERMRISSDGATSVFSSSIYGSLYSGVSAAAGTSHPTFVGRHSATTTSNGTISFNVSSNGDVTNTNNSYGAISDIKLKENIVDAGSQWDDLKALQVRKYNFKEETGQQTHTQIGLIAQEVELVSPGLVTESPDRDEEGNDLGTVTKSVNYSVLYMKAVKALQEAMERIETLEARLTVLEGGSN